MSLSVRQLFRMKKEDMLRLCEKWNIPNPPKKRDELFKILKEKLDSGIDPPAAAVRQPGNKDLFNQLTAESEPAGQIPPGPESETEQPKAAHGGARPGAGRKPGLTNEQCKINSLPQEPNLTIKYAVKWIFRFWARLTECPEIVLDEEELDEFSIDTTRFLEWHNIKIPQGLAVDAKFVGGGLELFGGRVAILKAHKARLKRLQDKEEQQQPGQTEQEGSGI